MPKVALTLKHTSAQIEGFIVDTLKSEINKFLKQAAIQVKKRVRELFKQRFLSSPTYISLTTDDLWHEFGIVDPTSKLDSILSALVQYIDARPILSKVTRGKNVGFQTGLELRMLDLSFQNITRLPDASQLTNRGENLLWLDWLLLQGGKTIVRGYYYNAVSSRYSRSGLGLMFEKDGRRWNVPHRFAGTANSNWLTRIIDSMDDEIKQIINDELEG